MAKFKDALGREWTLEIDIGTVSTVHDETGVSLYKLLEDKCQPLAQLIDNLPVLAHVCYLMAGEAAESAGHKAFAKGIKGDAISGMVSAFMEALTDFFPDARRRAAIAKLRQSWETVQDRMLDKLATEMQGIDPATLSEQVIATLAEEDATALQMVRDEVQRRKATLTTQQESLTSG